MKRMPTNQNNTQKRKEITSKPKSVVEQLAGSLKNSVPYVDHAVARKIAAHALGEQFLLSISITRFRQHFSRYIQRVRDGETIVLTHKKYPYDHFVIRPHQSKTDASIFAELVRI